jgi:hypothetical protein
MGAIQQMNYLYAGIALLLFGGGFYLGGLRGDVKAAAAQTALEADHAAMAQGVTTVLLAQRSQAAAQAAADNQADNTYAKDLTKIDTTAPGTAPLIVYRERPAALCRPAVPSAASETTARPADPAGGGGESVDRGRDIRPALEELKKRLELVMADYRRLEAEWPH